MIFKVFKKYLVLLYAVMLPCSLYAENLPSSPYRASLKLISHAGSGSLKLYIKSRSGIREKVSLRKKGNVQPVVISEDGSTSNFSKSVHYYGVLDGVKGQRSISVSVTDKKIYTFFTSKRGKPLRLNALRGHNQRSSAVRTARIVSSRASTSELCPERAQHYVNGSSVGARNAAQIQKVKTSETPVLEIATEADNQFYNIFKNETAAEIESIINSVDTIYSLQLGIRLKVTVISVRNAPGSAENSGVYIPLSTTVQILGSEAYTTERLGKFDLLHFFSGGKAGAQRGFAEIGRVCLQPSNSFSITTSDTKTSWVLVAHEIAHALGAEHDPYSRSIMDNIIEDSFNRFSEFSILQIQNHISRTKEVAGGSCLFQYNAGEAGLNPNKDPGATKTPTAQPTLVPGNSQQDRQLNEIFNYIRLISAKKRLVNESLVNINHALLASDNLKVILSPSLVKEMSKFRKQIVKLKSLIEKKTSQKEATKKRAENIRKIKNTLLAAQFS